MVFLATQTCTSIFPLRFINGRLESGPAVYSFWMSPPQVVLISQCGRVFLLDSTGKSLQELALRELSKSSLGQSMHRLLKATHLVRDYTTKRAREEGSFLDQGLLILKGFYQGLFSDPQLECASLEIDETRNILYLQLNLSALSWDRNRSSTSLLRVYDLGETNHDFRLVTEIGAWEILAEAYRLQRTRILSRSLRQDTIVSIKAFNVFESSAKLGVFFRSGLRVYIDLEPRAILEPMEPIYPDYYHHLERPSDSWYVLGARLPLRVSPGDLNGDKNESRTAHLDTQGTETLISAHFSLGQLCMVQESELYPNGPLLGFSVFSSIPSQSFISLPDGQTNENISPLGSHSHLSQLVSSARAFYSGFNQAPAFMRMISAPQGSKGKSLDLQFKPDFSFFSLQAAQIFSEPSVLALLLSDHAILLLRQRPLDQLFEALHLQVTAPPAIQTKPSGVQWESCPPLVRKELFDLLLDKGPVESCTDLIALGCSLPGDRFYLSPPSKKTFKAPPPYLLHRAEAEKTIELGLQLLFQMGSLAFTRAENFSSDLALSIRQVNLRMQMGYPNEAMPKSVGETLLLQALVIYTARLLRPLWNVSIFQPISSSIRRPLNLIGSMGENTLDLVETKINALLNFIHIHSTSIIGSSRTTVSKNLHYPVLNQLVEALQNEFNRSFYWGLLSPRETLDNDRNIRLGIYPLLEKAVQACRFCKEVVRLQERLNFLTNKQVSLLAQTTLRDLIVSPQGALLGSKYLSLLLLFESSSLLEGICLGYAKAMPLFFSSDLARFLLLYHKAVSIHKSITERTDTDLTNPSPAALVQKYRSTPEYFELKRVLIELQGASTQPFLVEILQPLFSKTNDLSLFFPFLLRAMNDTPETDSNRREELLTILLNTLDSLNETIKAPPMPALARRVANTLNQSGLVSEGGIQRVESFISAIFSQSYSPPLEMATTTNITRLMENFDLKSYLANFCTPSEQESLLEEVLQLFLNGVSDPIVIKSIFRWTLENRQISRIPRFSDSFLKAIVPEIGTLPIDLPSACYLQTVTEENNPLVKFRLLKALVVLSNLPSSRIEDMNRTHFPLEQRLDFLEGAKDCLSTLPPNSVVMTQEVNLIQATDYNLRLQDFARTAVKKRLYLKLRLLDDILLKTQSIDSEEAFLKYQDILLIQLLRNQNTLPSVASSELAEKFECLVYSILDPEALQDLLKPYRLYELITVCLGRSDEQGVGQALNFNLLSSIALMADLSFSKEFISEKEGLLYTTQGRQWPLNVILYLELTLQGLRKPKDRTEEISWSGLIYALEQYNLQVILKQGLEETSITNILGPLFQSHNVQYDYFWVPFLILKHKGVSISTLIQIYNEIALRHLHDSSVDQYSRFFALGRVFNNLVNLCYYLHAQKSVQSSSSILKTSTSSTLLSRQAFSVDKVNTQIETLQSQTDKTLQALLLDMQANISLTSKPDLLEFYKERLQKLRKTFSI